MLKAKTRCCGMQAVSSFLTAFFRAFSHSLSPCPPRIVFVAPWNFEEPVVFEDAVSRVPAASSALSRFLKALWTSGLLQLRAHRSSCCSPLTNGMCVSWHPWASCRADSIKGGPRVFKAHSGMR